MALLKHPLKYTADTASLFSRISAQPWAMLLDSGQPENQYGRYDIMVAQPFITVATMENAQGVVTQISQSGEVVESLENPFDILNTLMQPYQAAQSDLPFCGGAVGYFAYDLVRQIESLPSISMANPAIPHMMVGIYDWAVVVDHREKTACLVSHGFVQATRENWANLCKLFEADAPAQANPKAKFELRSHVTSNMDFKHYAQAFTAIKTYITEGDCYQVNLAQRFSAKARGNGWQAYQKLRKISPAPFMAYMNLGNLEVLSGSPERFLQVVNRRVETRPIKGTRPRSKDALQDQQYAKELQSSSKDRAENVMIVDLLRNDISKNCETGSVRADQLFLLQSFANVHHLVSIVTGMIKQDKSTIDLLKSCFPGGSITGAPKLRAMQIIEELEPHRRGVYCGAIGYIGFDGNMDSNIAIRTAVYTGANSEQGEITFYAGGGIVADSVLEKEYAETLDKAASLMKTMNFFTEK